MAAKAAAALSVKIPVLEDVDTEYRQLSRNRADATARRDKALMKIQKAHQDGTIERDRGNHFVRTTYTRQAGSPLEQQGGLQITVVRDDTGTSRLSDEYQAAMDQLSDPDAFTKLREARSRAGAIAYQHMHEDYATAVAEVSVHLANEHEPVVALLQLQYRMKESYVRTPALVPARLREAAQAVVEFIHSATDAGLVSLDALPPATRAAVQHYDSAPRGAWRN